MTDDAAELADLDELELSDTDPSAPGDAEPSVDLTFGLGEPAAAAAEAGSTGITCEAQLEDTLATLEQVTVQRDEYLQLAQRLQADFENYKRRVDGQRDELRERAAETIVSELLPVLDACDAAMSHGADDVVPVHTQLTAVLERRGLTRVAEVDVTFDPNVHEAVMSEPAADAQDGPEVAEVLRAGYLWNGRVLRPAMVRVRG